jgi:hypothetical protein
MGEASLRALRFLQSQDWSFVRRVRLSPATASELERLLQAFIVHVVERRLRSCEFIADVRSVYAPNNARGGP